MRGCPGGTLFFRKYSSGVFQQGQIFSFPHLFIEEKQKTFLPLKKIFVRDDFELLDSFMESGCIKVAAQRGDVGK